MPSDKTSPNPPPSSSPENERKPTGEADAQRPPSPGSFRVGAEALDADWSASDRDAPEYYAKDERPHIDPDTAKTGKSPGDEG
jgi:hypothetical protein